VLSWPALRRLVGGRVVLSQAAEVGRLVVPVSGGIHSCGSCGSFGGAAAGGCPRDWWTVHLVCADVLRSPRGRMSWARSCTSVHQRAALRHVAHAVHVLQRAGVPPAGARALSRHASVGVVCARVHQRTAARHGAQTPELQRAAVPRLVLMLLLELQRAVGPPVVRVILIVAGGGASVGARALVRALVGGGAALCERARACAGRGASGGARALACASVGGGAAAGRYCEQWFAARTNGGSAADGRTRDRRTV